MRPMQDSNHDRVQSGNDKNEYQNIQEKHVKIKQLPLNFNSEPTMTWEERHRLGKWPK